MSTHHDDGHHSPPSNFLLKYVFSTDHKVIGIQFLLTSLLFVIIGGLLALGVRYHIAFPGQDQAYYMLLPGTGDNSDVDGPKMTAKVAEANTSSWQIDTSGKIFTNKTIEVVTYQGQTFTRASLLRKYPKIGAGQWYNPKNDKRLLPEKMRGSLIQFPQGVAVTLKPSTIVSIDGAEEIVLKKDMLVLIGRKYLMPHPDHTKELTVVVPGTVAMTPGSNGKKIIIKGLERIYVGSPTPVKNYTSSIAFPVVVAGESKHTLARVQFADQTVRVTIPATLDVEFEGKLLKEFESLAEAGKVDALVAFYKTHKKQACQVLREEVVEGLKPYQLDKMAVDEAYDYIVISAAKTAILESKIKAKTGHLELISGDFTEAFTAAAVELDALEKARHHARNHAMAAGRALGKNAADYKEQIDAAGEKAYQSVNADVLANFLEKVTELSELDPAENKSIAHSIAMAKVALADYQKVAPEKKRDQLYALYKPSARLIADHGGKDCWHLLTTQYALEAGNALDEKVSALKSYYERQFPQDYLTLDFKGTTPIDMATGEGISYEINTLQDDGYATLFTMHASVMIFFVIIPTLVGAFGNFLIPLMIGARDMAFPKLNMLAYWLALPSGLIMILSFWLTGGAAGGGWTMYPTLSTSVFSKYTGTTLWVLGVIVLGFSSITGSLNYITTVINMRTAGMTMFRMPLTVWSIFITSILILFSTPVLTAVMIMLFLDRTMGTVFFDVSEGGQPLLWQHLFWFYSHPAVYIMILPAMGVTSDILATFSRKPIFGYKPMVFAMGAITGLGFIVWGHHMFQSGMNPLLGTTFMATTIMIAIPSAIKTFNWLGTLWGGNIKFTPPMLNALAFVSMFVIGGLSGIFMASAPVDIQIHDTYFIVGHIHYVLFGGSMFGIFAGVYYWYPKMFGRQMNQKWGVIHFIMTFIGFNGTFFLMHIVGVGGHPRRYASIMNFTTLHHLQDLNVMMTLFAMMLGMGQLPFFYNFFASLPKKLSRATIMIYVGMIMFPIIAGKTFWSAAKFGMDSGNTTFGFIALVLVLLYALYLCCTQLPTIGKVFSVLTIGPVLWFVCRTWSIGSSVSFGGEWDMIYYDMFASFGIGTIWVAVLCIGIYGLFELGEKTHATYFMQRALYVVFLPAFLMPLIVKPDVWTWLGIPGLHPQTAMQVCIYLVVLGLPGLAYLLIKRPEDQFGYAVSNNPWEANSLEWECTNPPIFINFEEFPVVHRGPYEFGSPVSDKDYLLQTTVLAQGVVEPTGH